MEPKATVLIPTHNHAALLPYSIQSALNQTVEEIEVFVVGDGAGDDSRNAVTTLTNQDSRVRFFDFQKGPRHGEIHRHEALAHARGKIICYLSDDDLWMPNHIGLMLRLLENADVANALFVFVLGNGMVEIAPRDYSLPTYRRRLANNVRESGTGLTFMAHTLAHYRRLPRGWVTSPPDIYTDQYFLKQLLDDPKYRSCSATLPSALCFASSLRRDWTMDERVAELQSWAQRIQIMTRDGQLAEFFLESAVRSMARRMAGFYDRFEENWTLPGPRRVLRKLAREVSGIIKR